jgi:PucR C-terminal helix-turn-helix domain/GGDEF-like domain
VHQWRGAEIAIRSPAMQVATAVVEPDRPAVDTHGSPARDRRCRPEVGGVVRSSRCGLQFDPRTPFEAWSAVGARIAGHAKATSWWLGDWVAFGERRYGQRYRLAIQATGLDYQTLRNYAVVARRFELSRRRDTLSLQHHAEVCALPDHLQDKWLGLAEINRWSKQELRRRVRQAASGETSAGVCLVRVSVDPERQQRWREAASTPPPHSNRVCRLTSRSRLRLVGSPRALVSFRSVDKPIDVGLQDPVAIQSVLNRIADAIDPEALGVEIGDLVIRDIPELAARADEDLRRSARSAGVTSLLDVWEGVRAGASLEGIAPPRSALAFAYELVHRGVDLGALLRAWRLGHALVEDTWERAANELEPDPELRWRALANAFRFFFAYVDAVSVQLTHAYDEERARWIRGSAAVRSEMVHALLAGELVPAAKASAALGYDVTHRHIGFILWADPALPNPGDAGALEGAAAAVGHALADGPCMLVPIGNWVVWGWMTADAADPPRAKRLPLPDGARAALGDPADGLDGFIRTHQEAAAARRMASLLGRRAGIAVRYRSVALLALLSADPLAATRFVETELGELAAANDSMARLRATLQVYLEENVSPLRTSRRLHISKNTVVYRVTKAEEILGHGLLERRQELEAALRLFGVLEGLRDSLHADADWPLTPNVATPVDSTRRSSSRPRQ